MKFYNKLREHFNNISAGGFWIRKKYSGRSQIIFGIAFGIIAVPIILINGPKFQPVVMLLLLAASLISALEIIIRGVHTIKMTKLNPDYASEQTEIDADERGRAMVHSAAYITLLLTYFVGIIGGFVLIAIGSVNAGIALVLFSWIQQMLFDVFRMCEERAE